MSAPRPGLEVASLRRGGNGTLRSAR